MRNRFIALAVVAAAGCSSTVAGPQPAPRAVAPGVVCAEQLTTAVTLSGDGFAPLVERGLEDAPRVVLPEVTLVRTAGPEGGAADAISRRVPDAPGDAAHGGLKWVDRTTLAFSITPALALAPGVYEVQVKSATGAGSVPAALLALPRPSVTRVQPAAVCTDAGGEVRVEGDFFLRAAGEVPEVTVGGQRLAAEVQDCRALAVAGLEACRQLTVQVPQALLAAGVADVRVLNPAPAACASTDHVEGGAARVDVVPPPTLERASPARICSGGGRLTLTGTALRPGSTVTLGASWADAVEVESDTRLTATFGPDLEPGAAQTVAIATPESCGATLTQTVDVLPTPQLFFVDPPVAYAGLAIELSVWGTDFGPNLSATLVQGDTRLPLDARFDPQRPSRLRAALPAGLAPGAYALEVANDLGCASVLADGLRVIDEVNVALDRVEPPFGWTHAVTGVTVFAATPRPEGAFGLQAVPGAWLTRAGGSGEAEPLEAVTVLDEARLTAVVPAGLAPGDYDLVLVNPDGSLGVLEAAFRVTENRPPSVSGLAPSSLPNDGPHALTIDGLDFREPAVEVTCRSADGATTTAPFQRTGFTVRQVTGTIDTRSLPAPAACVVRVTDTDDGTWADFSALVVTNPAQNLTTPKAGAALNEPRRAPSVAALRANGAARFLVAAGGDDGSPQNARDSVETNAIDLFGDQGPAWTRQRYAMTAKRAFAATVSIGRFVYAIGGTDGTGAQASAERAALLDPLFRPSIEDAELRVGRVGEPGLSAGVWYYRVAAVLGPDDPFNPDGETLASERLPLSLPVLTPARAFEVTLKWDALPGAVEYRVYRSPSPDAPVGSERLIATVPADAPRSWTDDGLLDVAADEAANRPLPLGSLGRWHPIAPLNVARQGAGVALVRDTEASNGWWIYVLGGLDAQGAALASIERVPVAVNGDGAQFVQDWVVDARPLSSARWQLGGFVGSSASTDRIASGSTYLWAGPGRAGPDGLVDVLEAAELQPDGSIGPFVSVTSPMNQAGYGAVLAGNFLYTFGGGGPTDTSVRQGEICAPSVGGCKGNGAPHIRNWNNATGTMQPRHLSGTVLDGATIYLVGGVGPSGTGASATTEQVIW